MSRSEYSDEERYKILWYIIKNDRYLSLRGNAVWKDMEHENVCDRTWQSMKSHFQNKIITNLFYYDIPQNKKDKLLHGYKSTCIKKKTKDGRTVRLPLQKVMIFSSDEEEIIKPVKQSLLKRKVTPDKLITESSDDSTDLLNEKVIRYSNKEDTNKQIIQLSPEVDLIKIKNTNDQLQETPSKIAKITRNLNSPNSKCRNTNLKQNMSSNKCDSSNIHIFASTSRVENIISVDENQKLTETANQVQDKKTIQSLSKSCKTVNKENQIETNNCLKVPEKINDTNKNLRTIIKCVRFEEEVTYIQPTYYLETRDQFVQVGNSTESKSTQLEINKCDTPTSNTFELNLLGDTFVEFKIGVDNHIFASASDMNLASKEIKDVFAANKEKIHIVNSETFNLLKGLHNINSACVQKVQAAVFSKELDFSGLKSYLIQMEEILNKVKETHHFAESISNMSEHSQKQNKLYSSSNPNQTLEILKTNTFESEEIDNSPTPRKMTTLSGITKITPSPTPQKYCSSQESEIMDFSKELSNSKPSTLIAYQKHTTSDLKINTLSPELLKYLTSTEPQKLDILAGIRVNRTPEYENRSIDSVSRNCPQKNNSLSETRSISPPELNVPKSPLINIYISPESQTNEQASNKVSQNDSSSQTSKTTTRNTNPSPKCTQNLQEIQNNSAKNSNKSSSKQQQNNSINCPENSEPNSQLLVSVPMEEDAHITNVISLLNHENQIRFNESIELPSTCESEAFYTAQSQNLNVTN